jgi:hypothetical protein
LKAGRSKNSNRIRARVLVILSDTNGITLTQAGFPLDAKVAYGIWEWKKFAGAP